MTTRAAGAWALGGAAFGGSLLYNLLGGPDNSPMGVVVFALLGLGALWLVARGAVEGGEGAAWGLALGMYAVGGALAVVLAGAWANLVWGYVPAEGGVVAFLAWPYVLSTLVQCVVGFLGCF